MGRAIVREPKAFLMDEPLSNLDAKLRVQMRTELGRLHSRLKTTTVYVTHDQVEALTFAEHVAVMHEGAIVQTGTPKDLFENPEHKFVGYFIGSPGMNFLPCAVDGNVAHVNGADITLDKDLAAAGSRARGKLEIGIRPMYLQHSSEPGNGGVSVQVQAIEDFGSYKIVTVMLAGIPIRVRLEEDMPIPSVKTRLVFPPRWIRLYADGRLVGQKE
jgi:glycerol transport system ATP-binding protein